MRDGTAMTPAWEELLSVALVGTDRKPAPATAVALAGTVVGGDVRGPTDEATVLTAAAVLAARRRAGMPTPHVDAVVPAAAPDDPAPEASPAAARLLELVLDGQVGIAGGSTPIAREWLGRCATAGRRLPARLLPAVLDRASVVRDLRAPATAAGGPRLRWLAARNPAWSWVAAADTVADPAVWTTGGGDRFAALVAVRAADPAAARDLVGATWSGEKAADRARILEVLRTNLDDADEPFLEAALDDRAGGVRAAAADVLACLPTSRLANRMAARLEPLVRVTGRLRRKLDVGLPDEPDGASRRDGVGDAGAPGGTGRRSWWLVQLVGAAPLPWWTTHLGSSPEALVALPHAAEVRQGWVLAAARQRDAHWARALLALEAHPSLLTVLDGVDPAEAAATLAGLLRAAKDVAVPGLLAAVGGPWPPATSAAAVERLAAVKTVVVLEDGLGTVATRADPEVVDLVERWVGELAGDDRRRRLVREVVHALSLRRAIAEALT